MASIERKPDAAVLVLMWGWPPRVLMERKSCALPGRFSCDVAFPGGRIIGGESPAETALREAWEEAWIPPSYVKVAGSLGLFATRSEPVIYTEAVLGHVVGPVDPMPRDPEVDAVFWVDVFHLPPPSTVVHRRRGPVYGIEISDGLVLWGMTLRIVEALRSRLGAQASQLDQQHLSDVLVGHEERRL